MSRVPAIIATLGCNSATVATVVQWSSFIAAENILATVTLSLKGGSYYLDLPCHQLNLVDCTELMFCTQCTVPIGYFFYSAAIICCPTVIQLLAKMHSAQSYLPSLGISYGPGQAPWVGGCSLAGVIVRSTSPQRLIHSYPTHLLLFLL